MANKNVIFCDPKLLEKDLSGKTYVVTGANSGVGFETTQQLVKQGAHVVMACRRVDAGKEVAQGFSIYKGSYEIMRCDLADLQSVRDFVEEFLSKHKKLDGLACNAGMVNMENTPKYTKDGFEITMAASFYGHFLLTELLLETLKNTANSRMLILSSVAHAGSNKKRYQLHFDDLEWKTRKYNNFDAYSEAKVASILYAKELAERLIDTSVTTYSVHPGWARSNFGGGGNPFVKVMMTLAKPIFTMLNFSDSSWESAQTSLHCLLSEDAPKHSGKYFSQHSVLYNDKECKKGGWPMQTPNPHADDMNDAHKIVNVTRGLVGLN
ncbi:SDR family NAD(P)-dependent oxidoreductase [Flammeovirga sp. MY04]|uniref:SDR family NAD(P)-dependent oxidoreductase n=1 Tax=Flammeovirga sp. MY04 TaxID=1191459 RepID=UPI0008060F65|nr:SDR family NAD(P)-dependent oxidoreductase [Flammeovirga sp. MY04]ANQ51459.1 SDR family NAD(P)-dependent oxidoreductase [Flammeovirga sp. MY04]